MLDTYFYFAAVITFIWMLISFTDLFIAEETDPEEFAIRVVGSVAIGLLWPLSISMVIILSLSYAISYVIKRLPKKK